VVSLIAALIVQFSLPETKPAPHPDAQPETVAQTFGGYGRVFQDGLFMAFVFVTFLEVIVYMNMNTTLGVYLRDVHQIPLPMYGWIISLNAAMVVLFQFGITRALKNQKPMLMMAAGTALYAIGFAMYGFVNTYLMFLVAMVVITIGEMVVSPFSQALVAQFAPEAMRGRYMAVFGLSWGAGFAVGPALAGLVLDNLNPNWLWYACGVVGTISALGFLLLNGAHLAKGAVEAEPAAT
jgi:MFS family permease